MFHKRDKSKERPKEKQTDILDNVNEILRGQNNVENDSIFEPPNNTEHNGPSVTNSKPNSRSTSRERLFSNNDMHHNNFFSKVEGDAPFKDMIANGLGKILYKTIAHIDEIAKNANLGLPKSFLDETCKDFDRFINDLNDNIDCHVQQSFKNIHETIENKVNTEFISHNEKKKSLLFDNHTESFYPPQFRQPYEYESDILTDHKLNIVNNTFPIRQKFNGGNSPTITEFLRNVISAQEQCDLTERQFKIIFLRCVTGAVYEQVSSLMDGNVTIPEIFNSLLIKYDNRIKPEEAQRILENYNVPRNADFNNVVSSIMSLAQRASQMHPRQSREAVYNFTAVNSLQKHLPYDSQSDGRKIFADLNCELGHTPSFDEYVRALRRYSTSIDYNYKKEENRKNFKNYRPLPPRSSYNITPRNATIGEVKVTNYKQPYHNSKFNKIITKQPHIKSAYNIFNYNKQYEAPKPFNSSYQSNLRNYNNTNNQQKSYPNSYRQASYLPRNKQYYNNTSDNYNKNRPITNYRPYQNSTTFPPKSNMTTPYKKPYKYCSLCGKTGSHNSQDYCYEMRTNSGHFRFTSTVEAPCDTCKKEEKKDLFHPSYLCFNRPRAKYLKANNLWKPPTLEQKEEMKKNALQNHI